MAPRRIIADSDDEDDGFSPEVSPQKAPADALSADNPSEAPIVNGSSSTDSRFFQSVYDQQQESLNVIASLQFLARARGDPIQDDSSSRQNAPKQTSSEQTSVLSSVTDPTQPSKRREKRPAASHVIDLTQVTTPGRAKQPVPPRDVWDVPSSAEQGAGRSSHGATSRPSKRRKTDDADSHVDSNASAGTLQPTQLPTSIFIEPQTLSPSRRMLYQSVQPSSDDRNQSSQFAAHYHQVGVANMSSGSATIAYPTPTQARHSIAQNSSHQMNPNTESPAEGRSKRARVAVEAPGSSPDILSVADMLPPKTNSRHRDDELERDDEEYPQERYQPRPSRRRAAAESAEDLHQTTAVAGEGTGRALFDAGPESLPPRKRRGRPKKSEDTAPAGAKGGSASIAPAEAGPVKNETVAPPEAAGHPKKEKRRRGRPRKTDRESAADAATGLSARHEAGTDAAEALEQPDKDQAHGDVTEKSTAHEGLPDVTPLTEADTRPLQDKSVNEAGGAPPRVALLEETLDKGGDHMGVEEGAKRKEGTKKTSSSREPSVPQTTPGSKPLYRVGLSKRSRIAPLLKSLKKT